MATDCLFAFQKSVKINFFFNRTPDSGTPRPCSSRCRTYNTNSLFPGKPNFLQTKNGNLQSTTRIGSSKFERTDYTREFRKRSSADEVCIEIHKCYELVHKLGRGVLYLGSSRTKPDHHHFLQAMELARETASLLECTTWSGVGSGLMDSIIKGALQAGKSVGGFKIAKEAGEWSSSNFHPYLPPETYITCRFFSARKHGLVDAAVRNNLTDQTAIIGLPGGIGTLDEIFEVLTLIQLERIGSKYPVPFILMNYDGFYSKLLQFIDTCENWGTVSHGEVDSLWKVCNCNLEALEYLADFYDIPESRRKFRGRLREAYV